jgi:hypothetical protein
MFGQLTVGLIVPRDKGQGLVSLCKEICSTRGHVFDVARFDV